MQISPCRDGDAKILWCKCLLMGLSWCKCPFVGMQWCRCPFVGMPWCKCPIGACHDANAFCRYVVMQMPLCGYIMTWMLWCKHNLFKNLLYFQNEASSAPNFFFKTWFIISWNVMFFLTWGSQKKLVITVRNLLMGHWLRIWWSGSKYLFSKFGWAKGVVRFRGLSLEKMNSLKIKHFKRIHFFSFWIWQFDMRQDPPW